MVVYTYLLDLNSVRDLKDYIKLTLVDVANITFENTSRNVDIYFNSSLTPEQKSTLDTLLTTFPNDPVVQQINYKLVFSSEKKINNSNWVSVCRWICSEISSIEILSSMVPNNNSVIGNSECSYEVRGLNLSTNQIILSPVVLNFLDEEELVLEFDTKVYKKSKIDIQFKKNTLCSYVTINSIGYI